MAQFDVTMPPPVVVDKTKPAPLFTPDSTAYNAGAALRGGISTAADTLGNAAVPVPLTALKTAAGAVAPTIKDFGKGLLGMNDTPTLPDTPAAASTIATPPAAAAPAPAGPTETGFIGGPAAPTAAVAPAPPKAATDIYPVQPPNSISQYLPQLMAAAASRNSEPVVNTVAPPSPFTDRAGNTPDPGTWDDLFNNKYQRSVQAQANKTNIEAFNAGTQRRTADAGVLNTLIEPVKADQASQTQLAAAGMTTNTARATNEATNVARQKEVETTGEYGVKRAQELASARKYAADKIAQGKGSAVQKTVAPNGKIVMTQLNDKGELASRVIDPDTAMVHQQADAAVMAAQNGDEVIIPGGKGIVKIVNGVRKVYDKKTGKDIGWTPPPAFSTVGMPNPGGGNSSGMLEDFLDQQ